VRCAARPVVVFPVSSPVRYFCSPCWHGYPALAWLSCLSWGRALSRWNSRWASWPLKVIPSTVSPESVLTSGTQCAAKTSSPDADVCAASRCDIIRSAPPPQEYGGDALPWRAGRPAARHAGYVNLP
jgi:hypothetical protein